MNIQETRKQITELQHLIGTKIPGTDLIIDDIIPAPTDYSQFDEFLLMYLKTNDIVTTIYNYSIQEFEILLLADSKSKSLFDIKSAISNAWYRDYF